MIEPSLQPHRSSHYYTRDDGQLPSGLSSLRVVRTIFGRASSPASAIVAMRKAIVMTRVGGNVSDRCGAPGIQHSAGSIKSPTDGITSMKLCTVAQSKKSRIKSPPSIHHPFVFKTTKNLNKHENEAQQTHFRRNAQKGIRAYCFRHLRLILCSRSGWLKCARAVAYMHARKWHSREKERTNGNYEPVFPMGLGMKHGSQEGRDGILEVSLTWQRLR
jgi:hypothetical protein